MKIIITIADLVLCSILIYGLITEFYTGMNLLVVIAVLSLLIILILNIFLINFKSNKGWLALYLKRKALEEKNKIDKLTKEWIMEKETINSIITKLDKIKDDIEDMFDKYEQIRQTVGNNNYLIKEIAKKFNIDYNN